jgi:hypothetical protein
MIVDAVAKRQHALKIDLKYGWWSTRLYLIAALAERLTHVRRILIIKTGLSAEEFIGRISTAAIQSIIGPKVPVLDNFLRGCNYRPASFGGSRCARKERPQRTPGAQLPGRVDGPRPHCLSVTRTSRKITGRRRTCIAVYFACELGRCAPIEADPISVGPCVSSDTIWARTDLARAVNDRSPFTAWPG